MLDTHRNGNGPLVNPAGCYHLQTMAKPALKDKVCIRCGNKYPHTKENFFHHKRDGLTGVCLACHKAERRLAVKKAASKRRANLRAIETAGVDLYAKLAQAGGSNIPHSAELVEKVCEYFGGVAGFAAIMVKQYYDAKPGTSTRNKLLETVTRLITVNVDAGGAKKPLTLWTEDELETELRDRFRQAVISQRLVIDAKEAPPAEPAQDSGDPDADAAPEGADQGTAIGDTGAETGSVEALSPDADAGASPPVQGQ